MAGFCFLRHRVDYVQSGIQHDQHTVDASNDTRTFVIKHHDEPPTGVSVGYGDFTSGSPYSQ